MSDYSLLPRKIDPADKAGLNILFLAKHACAHGMPDPVDGNHAVYHHELRQTLENIGVNLLLADSYDALNDCGEPDFIFTLLNRGGFVNSEMLAPLMARRHNIPFLGASPIIRGISDDKHMTKLMARACGIPTMEWQIFRKGALPQPLRLRADRLVVKPNASSASWGVLITEDRKNIADHIAYLHAGSHDAIVEEWAPALDVAVPVVGGSGTGPWLLPALASMPTGRAGHRSYEEKRGLIAGAEDDELIPVADMDIAAELERQTQKLLPELWPFDYGRFEYRIDPANGAVRLMEVNLSCNLWSKKTISRSAALVGIDHATLVESILAHSLARQDVTERSVVGRKLWDKAA